MVVGLVSNYFNQTLVWKHVASINDYNEPTYTTSTIKGRKEPGNNLVRNSQGQEVVSSAVIFTRAIIAVNDLIDGRLVISSEPMPLLNGNTLFYEVYLI